MSENIELCYVCDHTIIKILSHDIHSKMGNMIKEWVIFNKLEDFNSLLKYTDDDFTPTGDLCYINQNGEKLYRCSDVPVKSITGTVDHDCIACRNFLHPARPNL